MFNDEQLLDHLQTVNTLKVESLVTAEWNLNDLQSIANYGNYRYRPNDPAVPIYNALAASYDVNDEGNFYVDALESTTISQYAVENDDASLLFTNAEVDRSLYFSLKECFQPFRPRSGINKALFFDNKYIDNITSAKRPRYYLASRYDKFKYWNSYRRELYEVSASPTVTGSGLPTFIELMNNSTVQDKKGVVKYTVSPSATYISKERGISNRVATNNIGYEIDDAVPFVVYENNFAINRIVVKMQTNLAETSKGTIRNRLDDITLDDPLGDINKSSIPKRWSVQYLDENNNWVTATSFNENSTRRDGTNIVKYDGYVELYYGILIPEEYKTNFNLVQNLSSSAILVNGLLPGEAYLVGATETDPGDLYIWNGTEWDISVPEYGFSLLEDDDTKRIGMVRTLVDPEYFEVDGIRTYREVKFIKGLRIVVESMYGPETTFDLIELSPRLKADISNYVVTFETNRSIAKSNTGLPVGGLVASNGQITLMNYDEAFSENNDSSLIKGLLKPNVKFDFYEAILNVDGFDKFIPIKTLYSEEFPVVVGGLFDVTVPLRDNYFRFETATAPSILLNNTTLTKAVAVLLDSIGFSNYIFRNITTKNDPVVPFFFIEPDASVADVLERLAISTQTAMFFDENNDFVVMTKDYLLPDTADRSTDYVLYGQRTALSSGSVLPNIIEVSGVETRILNNGKINYVTRYIQRSPASLSQATKIDEDRTYIYKPVLLWEVGNDIATKTINEQSKSTGFSLGAVALNTTLDNQPPRVENNTVVNNIIDLGENVYWLPRFQGYLYSSGEIIRYDAVEYIIPGQGTFWITNNQEYQKYFANLPFNGKMYPTGNIRIYAEPYYINLTSASVAGLDPGVTYKNGEVKSHGRGQFGTDVVTHTSGISPYWTSNDNVRGLKMNSSFIFSTTPTNKISFPPKSASATLFSGIGIDNSTALSSSRSSIIANFMRQSIPSDDVLKNYKTTTAGTIQSSALVFTGPSPMPTAIDKRDFVTYVTKTLDLDYKHFGTRMRIIGKSKYGDKILTPQNPTDYYSVQPLTPNDTPKIEGGSGGISVLLNSNTGCGYYFEIVSLTGDNLERYTTADPDTGETTSVLHNVIFYKVQPGVVSGETVAVPYKLWGGIAKILVDEGRFVGNDRIVNQDNPTVYDLSVEYEDIGTSIRRFYLYLNNKLISVVDDPSPLPKFNDMALFVRGSAKCMFDNIYALKNLQSKESSVTVVNSTSKPFSNREISSSEALRTYAMSGIVQSTYLSGLNPSSGPKYSIYFDEFGTIFRECAYFNIKYDKAYPAFLAFLAPTFNSEKTYTASGFRAGSYGAEFLIFNNTDKAIVLDETSGSYLRIIGVTFTQNTSGVLTVDDFYKDLSNFSDPVVVNGTIVSPQTSDKIYQDVKLSRSKYGDRSFTLESPYIQSYDQARDIMEWMTKKTIRPRKNIYVETFGTPHIQLGDLLTINYRFPEQNDKAGTLFVEPDKKFVVTEIFYSRSASGIRNRLRMVEA